MLIALAVSLISCQSSRYCRLHYEEDETIAANGEQTQFKFIEYETPSDDCICDNGRCLIKCCPYGKTINQEIECADTNDSLVYNYVIHDGTEKIDAADFNLVYVTNASCFEIYDKTYLQQDGKLYLTSENLYLPLTGFCWDVNELGEPTQWECVFSSSPDSLVQGMPETNLKFMYLAVN